MFYNAIGKVIKDNKLQLLAQTFVKVHSTDNLSNEEKEGEKKQEQTLQDEKKYGTNECDDRMKYCIKKSGKKTPGKDQVNV